MSILNVNTLQPVGSGQTITVSAANITASSAALTVGSITNTSGSTVVAAGSASAPSISPTGDSNTGIFFPAADTVAIAEGGAEALRITSSGDVGIGSVSPANVLDVQGNAHAKIHIGTTGNGYATGIQINHAKGAAGAQSWQIQTDATTDGNLKIRNATSGNDVMFFREATDNVEISNGNLVFSTAGKGIDFSAASGSAAGSTSALLDDYEEGTWTPTLNGFTNAGIFQTAEYIKIGRKVTVYLNIYQSSNNMSFTATSLISGLPFTTINSFHTAVSAVAFDVSENTDIIAAWLSPTTPVVKLKTASSSRRHIVLQVSYYTTT